MNRVMHYNPHLPHQINHAVAFRATGFNTTSKVYLEADIHAISGPWYAYDEYRNHPRTLMIDRAWWGDPDCVSLGWIRPGSKKRAFASGDAPRSKPEYEPWKTREESCLICADYGQDVDDIAMRASERFDFVEIRRHPADSTFNQPDLKSAIRLRDVVICHSGTAGFEALMMGVPVICTDPDNEIAPVCAGSLDDELYRGDRAEWLHEMSYKQFSLAEIADGTAWNLLKDVQ